jgi:hypothetical protein
VAKPSSHRLARSPASTAGVGASAADRHVAENVEALDASNPRRVFGPFHCLGMVGDRTLVGHIGRSVGCDEDGGTRPDGSHSVTLYERMILNSSRLSGSMDVRIGAISGEATSSPTGSVLPLQLEKPGCQSPYASRARSIQAAEKGARVAVSDRAKGGDRAARRSALLAVITHGCAAFFRSLTEPATHDHRPWYCLRTVARRAEPAVGASLRIGKTPNDGAGRLTRAVGSSTLII